MKGVQPHGFHNLHNQNEQTTITLTRKESPYQERAGTHTLCLAGLALTLLPLPAFAITITLQPTGLNPGDTYHLAFVGESAVQSNRFMSDNFTNSIADYNAFVQAVADNASTTFSIPIGAAEGFTWTAIVSTIGTNTSAADNIGVLTSPIYNFGDQLVANDSNELFGGTLQNPINITEFGSVKTNQTVWMGSTSAGAVNFPLQPAPLANRATIGLAQNTNAGWIDSGESFYQGSFPLYAISNKQTVPGGPAVIPEPTTFILFGTGLVGLFAWRMRKGRA